MKHGIVGPEVIKACPLVDKRNSMSQCGQDFFTRLDALRMGCGRALVLDAPVDRGNLPLDSKPYSNADIAVRCLDCGVLFCPACARKHFAESGSEKDKQILRLEAALEEAALCVK